MKQKYLTFDVMLRGLYVCTLHYPLTNAPIMLSNGRALPLVSSEQLEAFTLQQRPTLRGKKYKIIF